MGKILLIFPELEKNKQLHHIPLSVLAIAAPLEHRGIKYEIFDERVDGYDKLESKLEDVAIVGITMFTGHQTSRAYEILNKIKSIDNTIIIVAGGPHVTSLPEQILASELVNYVVVGYGDEVFCKLVECIINQGTAQGNKIPGIGYLDADGSITINKELNAVGNDYWHNLPYNKIDINKYINPATELVMYVTTYGCPGKCTFCATPCTRTWIQKPIELVISDLKFLYDQYQFKQIVFNDATLLASKKRTFEIIGSLKKFPNVEWCAFSRADEIIKYSKEELERIKTTGGELISLTVGLESGSQRVATEIMKRGRNHLAKFEECIRKLVDVSIPVVSGLIFGIPGDTPDDVRTTIEYISQIRKIYPGFRLSSTFFRPLPGTELYYSLKLSGFELPCSFKEWASYAERNHYTYNEWNDIFWMSEKEKEEYRKAYDRFLERHGSILI